MKVSQETLIPAVLLLNAALFTGIFFVDYTRSSAFSQGESAGRVIYKFNAVDRKSDRRVVWNSVSPSSSLFARDTIRSHSRSNAVIELNDGTRITLDENSMIFLDISEDSSLIDFQSGSIQVKNSGNSQAKITSEGTEILLNDSDVMLNSGENGENLQLFVKSGKAVISSENERVELDPGNRLNVNGDSFQVGNIKVHLVRPKEQEIRSVPEGRKGDVRFAWTKDETFDSAVLQVAHDSRFQSLLLEKETNQNYVDAGLPGGAYYWRVLARDRETGELEQSAPSRVLMVEKTPVTLVTPSASSEVETAGEGRSEIPFRWSVPSVASVSVLTVAEDSQFRNKVIEKEVKSSGTTVSGLKPGDYYWKVSVTPEAEGITPSESTAAKFTVVSVTEPRVPEPVTPLQNQKIHPESASGEGIFIVWKARREAESYQVQVSPDSSFSRITDEKRVRENHATVKIPPESLNKKQDTPFYWRVKTNTEEGKSSPFSAPHRIVISESVPKQSDSVPPENSDMQPNESGTAEPEPETEKNTAQELTFFGPESGEKLKWPRSADAVSYIIEYRKKGKSEIFRRKSTEPFLTLDMEPGVYETRIIPLKKDGASGKPGQWIPVRIQPDPAPKAEPFPEPVTVTGEDQEHPLIIKGENFVPRTSVKLIQSGTGTGSTDAKSAAPSVSSVKVSDDRRTLTASVKTTGASDGNYSAVIENPGHTPVTVSNVLSVRTTKKLPAENRASFEVYIKSLESTCGDRSIPDILISDCREGYQILHLKTKQDFDLYHYLKLKSPNHSHRRIGYDYFRDLCPVFLPAYEMLSERLRLGTPDYDQLEKNKLRDSVDTMNQCRQKK